MFNMADISEKRFIGHLMSFESSFAVDSVDFQNLLAAAFLAVPFRALCVLCVLVMVRRPGLLLLISMISSYLCR